MNASQSEVAGAPTPIFPNGTTNLRTDASQTKFSFWTGALVAARQFGKEGRTSIGIGADYVNTHDSVLSLTSLTNQSGTFAREKLAGGTAIMQARVKLGIARKTVGGHKFGLFYRYGISSVNNRDRLHTFNDLPLALNSFRYSAHSSEVGGRLRGPLTKHLFYGLEGSILSVKLNEVYQTAVVSQAHDRERIKRFSLSGGLGYALRPRTILSLDFAGGTSRVKDLRSEDATGKLLEDEKLRNRFGSAHAGIQSDVWRRLFVSASALAVTQARQKDVILYPDRFGRLLNGEGIFVPNGRTKERLTDYFSDFGIGWRFKPNLIGQYVLSTDYRGNALSHIFLLRYTFRRDEK